MTLFFAVGFSIGLTCFFIFTKDVIDGKLTRNNTWKDMTIDQWVLFFGTLLLPISMFGLFIVESIKK